MLLTHDLQLASPKESAAREADEVQDMTPHWGGQPAWEIEGDVQEKPGQQCRQQLRVASAPGGEFPGEAGSEEEGPYHPLLHCFHRCIGHLDTILLVMVADQLINLAECNGLE